MCSAWRHAGHPCMASEPDCASGPQQVSCRRESDRARAGHSGGACVCSAGGRDAGPQGRGRCRRARLEHPHRNRHHIGGDGGAEGGLGALEGEAMWHVHMHGQGVVQAGRQGVHCPAEQHAHHMVHPPQQALFLIPPMATHAPPMVRTQPACMHGAWMGVWNTELTVAGRAGEQQ